jgi:hypothetical protein
MTVNAEQICANAHDVKVACGSEAVCILDPGRHNDAVIGAVNDSLIENNGELNHSLVIAASDFVGKQGVRICDWFCIECE